MEKKSSADNRTKIIVAIISAIALVVAAIIKNPTAFSSNKEEDISEVVSKEPKVTSHEQLPTRIESTLNKDSIAIEFYNKALKTDKLVQELEYLNKAINYKKDNYQYYYQRGKVKIQMHNHVLAINDLDTAIMLNENYAPAFDHRGLAKFHLCQQATEDESNCWSAMKDFDRVIELFELEENIPKTATAFYNKAVTYQEVRKFCDALDNMRLADRSNPNKIYKNQISILKSKCKR